MRYDAGNVGDLIKHEWLLRCLDWLPRGGCFYDPFAGQPEYEAAQAVGERLLAAPADLLLREAQSDALSRGRYLGSTGLAERLIPKSSIHCFDEDANKRDALQQAGYTIVTPIDNDGYRALAGIPTQQPPPQLLLLDPYNLLGVLQGERQGERPDAFWSDLATWPRAVLLFILNKYPDNSTAALYAARLRELGGKRPVAGCLVPPISNSGIKGERKSFVEMLYLPEKSITPYSFNVRCRSLARGADAVAETLRLAFARVQVPTYSRERVEFCER
ncbi:MAG: hypothetical protein GF399_06165 [Candidatus Coatesbacteria bacterium]|nr:hypothetical protein [Candidatus Coatesbacteria bacterium]